MEMCDLFALSIFTLRRLDIFLLENILRPLLETSYLERKKCQTYTLAQLPQKRELDH